MGSFEGKLSWQRAQLVQMRQRTYDVDNDSRTDKIGSL